MKKSQSTPSLCALGGAGVQLQLQRRMSFTNSGMRKSVSTTALTELHVPNSPIEQLGFHSLLKASPVTTYDCAINYQTVDFPKQLLKPDDPNNSMALAACIATPSDPLEPKSPVYRQPLFRWLEMCTNDERMAERFNNLRRKLKRRS